MEVRSWRSSKVMEVKFKQQTVKPFAMFNAGRRIRAYRLSSCLNLIGNSVRPEGPYGPYTAREAWKFTTEGNGLGFTDFESFERFTRKRLKPFARSELGVNSDRSVWLYVFTSIRECPDICWTQNGSAFNNNTGWQSHHNSMWGAARFGYKERGAARFGYKEREVKSVMRIRVGLGWRMVPMGTALSSAYWGAVSATSCLPPVPKKSKHYDQTRH